MYKLVAIDLDETLYDDNHQICQRNIDAIAKARAMGVKIVPCSGRSPKFLGNLYERLGIDEDNEYSILANGGIIIENKSNKSIDVNPIPFAIVEKLFAFGRAHDVCVQIFLKDRIHFYYIDEEEKRGVENFGDNLVFLESDDISDLKEEEIIKVLFQKVDMPYLQSLEKPLKPITDGEIAVSFSSNRYLELNRIGIDKGVGLAHLANHLNIPISETIAIGDNLNDFQMIETAGLGCAVQNAREEIKNIATYICKSDNNEGAVAEVIETFILKK